MSDIPEDVHNEKLDEKAVIQSITENRWVVEVTENLFDLFEDTEWIDSETRDEVNDLWENTQSVLDEFELPNGYDTDKIRSLDSDQRKNITDKLAKDTSNAIEYNTQLLTRVSGQHDVVERLPSIVRSEVDAVFEDNDDVVVEPEFDYGDFAAVLENHIDYGQFDADIDTDELAATVAADVDATTHLDVDEAELAAELGVTGQSIAQYLEIDEEEIAYHLEEKKIGEGVDAAEVGRNVSISENKIQNALSDVDVDLDQEDYQSIGRAVANNINVDSDIELDDSDYAMIARKTARQLGDDMDMNLTQSDYQRIGQEVSNHIENDGGMSRRGYGALAATGLLAGLAGCFSFLDLAQDSGTGGRDNTGQNPQTSETNIPTGGDFSYDEIDGYLSPGQENLLQDNLVEEGDYDSLDDLDWAIEEDGNYYDVEAYDGDDRVVILNDESLSGGGN